MDEDYLPEIQLDNIRTHLAELESRNTYLGNSGDGYQIGVDFQTNQPVFRRPAISEEIPVVSNFPLQVVSRISYLPKINFEDIPYDRFRITMVYYNELVIG